MQQPGAFIDPIIQVWVLGEQGGEVGRALLKRMQAFHALVGASLAAYGSCLAAAAHHCKQNDSSAAVTIRRHSLPLQG